MFPIAHFLYLGALLFSAGLVIVIVKKNMIMVLCFAATNFMKRKLHVDDSLDVFPVHGVGGLLGTLMTGIFASSALGIFSGQEDIVIGHQFGVQAVGAFSSFLYTMLVTFVLLKLVGALTPLRVSAEDETQGLDLVLHNERGYDL